MVPPPMVRRPFKVVFAVELILKSPFTIIPTGPTVAPFPKISPPLIVRFPVPIAEAVGAPPEKAATPFSLNDPPELSTVPPL
jgi:hypothetical protein